MARIDQYKQQITRLGTDYGTPRLSNALNSLLDSNDAALHSDRQELQRALQRRGPGITQYLRDNANFFREAIKKMYDAGRLAYGEIADLNDDIDNLQARINGLQTQVNTMRPIVRGAARFRRRASQLDAIVDAVNNFHPPATPQPSRATINYLRNL